MLDSANSNRSRTGVWHTAWLTLCLCLCVIGCAKPHREERCEQVTARMSAVELMTLERFKGYLLDLDATNPTDEVAEGAGRILLRYRCSQAEVRQLIGKPEKQYDSDLGGREWSYVLGDDRFMVISFDQEGRAMAVNGRHYIAFDAAQEVEQ